MVLLELELLELGLAAAAAAAATLVGDEGVAAVLGLELDGLLLVFGGLRLFIRDLVELLRARWWEGSELRVVEEGGVVA